MVRDKKIRLLIILQMIMIAMGAVSLPALITTFQKEYSLTIAQSAIIPILSTLGGFLTNLLIASYSAKVGLKKLNLYFLVIGLMAAIILAFTNNIYLFLTGILLIGINTAFGLTNTSTIFAHIQIKYQNYGLFHAFFGVGGIITPAIISLLFSHQISYRFFYCLLIGLYTTNILYVFFSNLIENKKYERIRLKEAFRIVKKTYVLPVLILIAIQAGSEQSVVTWSGNFFDEVLNYNIESASLFLSLYWVMFTLARFFVHFVENKIGKLNTAKISVGSAIVSIFLLLLTNHPVFFLLLAVSMGPTFPLMQKYSVQKLPDREVGLFNGLVFAVSSIGNVFISGSMGWLGDYNIKISYVVPVLGSIMTLFIIFYLANLKKTGSVSVGPR